MHQIGQLNYLLNLENKKSNFCVTNLGNFFDPKNDFRDYKDGGGEQRAVKIALPQFPSTQPLANEVSAGLISFVFPCAVSCHQRI